MGGDPERKAKLCPAQEKDSTGRMGASMDRHGDGGISKPGCEPRVPLCSCDESRAEEATLKEMVMVIGDTFASKRDFDFFSQQLETSNSLPLLLAQSVRYIVFHRS